MSHGDKLMTTAHLKVTSGCDIFQIKTHIKLLSQYMMLNKKQTAEDHCRNSSQAVVPLAAPERTREFGKGLVMSK